MRLLADPVSQPLRNLHYNPGGTDILTGSGQGGWQGSAPNAMTVSIPDVSWSLSRKARRLTWTTRSSASGDIGMGFSNAAQVAVWAGQRVTAVFDLVSSVGGWNLGTTSVSNITPVNSHVRHASSSGQPVTAGVPVRAWVTFTVPAGTTTVVSIRAELANLPLVDGVWVEASNMDLYFGDYQPGRMARGDLPGWQWVGTPESSHSVGYPYTLGSIAGGPVADLSASGVQTLALPVSTDALSMYLVGTRNTDTAAWTDINGINVTGSTINRPTGVAIQQHGTNAGQWQTRLDTAGTGQSGFNQAATSAVTLGAHVFAVTLTTGITSRSTYLDGAHRNTLGVIANAGVEVLDVRMQAASTSFTPHRLLVYKGTPHNAATVAQVTAWLARQYGAPVPAGY